MSQERDRKVGHWKRWGWAMTCSVCERCATNPGDYCPNCGAEMSEPEEWWCPPLPEFKRLTFYTCPNCGKQIIEPGNYCQYCGSKVEIAEE